MSAASNRSGVHPEQKRCSEFHDAVSAIAVGQSVRRASNAAVETQITASWQVDKTFDSKIMDLIEKIEIEMPDVDHWDDTDDEIVFDQHLRQLISELCELAQHRRHESKRRSNLYKSKALIDQVPKDIVDLTTPPRAKRMKTKPIPDLIHSHADAVNAFGSCIKALDQLEAAKSELTDAEILMLLKESEVDPEILEAPSCEGAVSTVSDLPSV